MATHRPRSYACLAATVVLAVATTASAEPPAAARVAEIAALLDAHAGALGQPCTDRAAWEALGRRKEFQEAIPAAEALLTTPLPELPDELFLDYSRTGNRRPWEKVAFARRGRIAILVTAECLENNGRFLPVIEETVQAICGEKTWVYPAHDASLRNFQQQQIDIDLGSSFVAAELGLTHYLLGDKLKPAVRALIETRVHTLVFDPFRDMVMGRGKANWWLTCTNNWNAVCLAGVTVAALALEDDRADRAFFIAAAEQYARYFLSGFTPDGYCSEGLGYWNYGFGRYAVLAIAVARATHGGVDLLAMDGAALPARFGSRVEIVGGVYPSFADCPLGTRPDAALVDYLNRRLGVATGPAEKDRIASPRQGLLLALAYAPWPDAKSPTTRPAAPPTPADSPLRTWFADAGVLICRPAAGVAGRMGVAVKGGNNAEHHNHNDVGTFIVVVGDRQVLTDPGAEVYMARTFSSRRYESKVLNSYGHPVPVVAGKLQRTGREAQGRVLRQEFTDACDTLVLDLTSAYDVPTLQRLERTFTYERSEPPCLTITDGVTFASPEAFEVALITHGTCERSGPDRLRVDVDGRAVDVKITVTGATYAITAGVIDEDVRTAVKPTRIAITLQEPVRSATVCVEIRPTAKESH